MYLPLQSSLLRRALLLFAVTLFCCCAADAQAGTPLFQVIHLPRKAGYPKEKLAGELAPLKDKEAVKKLLRLKNFPPGTTLVLLVNRPGAGASYWTVNASAPSDREDARIILQSRDAGSTRFYKLSEFKTFFKDTVALLDTLEIELLIHDEAYPDDGYVLSVPCGGQAGQKAVPLEGGKLLFTKALLDGCGGPVATTLTNKQNPGRALASFRLYFLSADEKERLLAIAAARRSAGPEAAPKDIATVVYGYAAQHFGRIPFPQLLHWLEQNGGGDTDGRP